uniref:Uncharacterized protein n=1 Tax=Anguilla anguilla TaxID=7936 RepID=A0A0E9WLK1_ANGAN
MCALLGEAWRLATFRRPGLSRRAAQARIAAYADAKIATRKSPYWARPYP